MADKQYTYAVARIRSKELSLLTKQDMEQLMACKSHKECLQLLSDKGWGNKESAEAEDIIGYERRKTWDVIRELVEDMSIFDVLLYENDFHNLKTAIKQLYMNTEFPEMYITHGTVPLATIKEAVKTHDFTLLPEFMTASGKEAMEVLLHTGDGQLCDLILDKAALESIRQAGTKSGNEVLNLYAEQKVAVADIKIAFRGTRTKKGVQFYQRALAACGSLDIQALMEAALKGEDTMYEYIGQTTYADAVPELKKSLFAFELWCDNRLMEVIRPQKYNPFTIAPLAAYIIARESELKTVRIILSGKLNSLSEESIRERIRESYV